MQWGQVGTIVMSWVISPVTAGIIAFLIYMSVQHLILRHDDPLARARRYVPGYMFLAAFTITLFTILKGLKHVGLTISLANSYLLATVSTPGPSGRGRSWMRGLAKIVTVWTGGPS